MKKIAIALLSATFLCSGAFAEKDNVVATFKGGEVKESQVMAQFKAILENQENTKGKKFSDLDANTQEVLCKAYLNTKFINEEAKKEHIEDSADFKEKLENIKMQLIQQTLLEKHLKSVVNDVMVDAAYDKVVQDLKGQQEIEVAHILVPTKEEATNIKKEIDAGKKTFEQEANAHSKDEGTKNNGGKLGFIQKGNLVPAFEEVAFKLDKNKVSDPVQTQFGYHIIKVLNKRAAVVPSKEEAKPRILAQLNRDAIEKYATDLYNNADVKLQLKKIVENEKEAAADNKKDAAAKPATTEKK